MLTADSFINELFAPPPQSAPEAHWPDDGPVPWIEEYFYVYDTGKQFRLHASQADAINLALSRDDDGHYNFDLVLWSWIKKSAKSTIIAAVVHYVACNQPRAQIRIVGHDMKQALSRVGHYLRGSIQLAQMHAPRGHPGEGVRNRDIRFGTRQTSTILYPNGSVVEMVPVDPRGEAGGNDDLIIFSELWAWKTETHQLMWAEMTPPPAKYGYAQRWIDTYAGFEGGSPILQPLYENIVVNGQRAHEEYEFYTNGRQFATWVTQPILTDFQTPGYYDAQARELDDAQFLRMHRNQWTSPSTSFLPTMQWWDDCLDTSAPAPTGSNHFREIVIAMDAGTNSDCMAIAAISRDWRDNDPDSMRTILQYAQAWYPEASEQDIWDEPLAELERLYRDFNVRQIACDPWQLKYIMKLLRQRGWPVDEFKQTTAERAEADKLWYDAIRARMVAHRGIEEMRRHINNSSKKDVDGKKLLIVKRDDKLKIDLNVAASMAHKRALEKIAI